MPTTETRKEKERTIRRVSKAVAEKVLEESELEGLEALDDAADETAIQPNEPIDIFETPTRQLLDQNDSPRYTIYKNNDLLTTKHYPYSWDRVQEEFGGGFYKIQLKRGNGTIFKTQQLSVAEPQQDEGEEFPSFFGRKQAGENKSGSPTNVMEMLTFMKTFNGDTEAKITAAAEAARREAREAVEKAERETRSASKDNSTMLTTFLTMMQTANQQSQTMMMEVVKSLNSKIDHAASAKKDGLDTATLIKMLSDAEEKGYQRRKDIDELADERAERLKEDYDEKHEKEPESFMGQLVKSFVPIISQAVKQNQDAQASVQTAQAQLPAPPTPAQIAEHQRQEQLRRVNANNEAARKRNAAQAAANARAHASGQSGEGSVQRDPLGLPKAAPTPKAQVQGSTKQKLNGNFKEHVMSLVFPVIADGLISNENPSDNAEKSLELLKKQGISPNDVLESFKLSDIIEIAHGQGVPPEADGWLAEYYKFIEGSATPGKGILKNAVVQTTPGNESQSQAVGASGSGATA